LHIVVDNAIYSHRVIYDRTKSTSCTRPYLVGGGPQDGAPVPDEIYVLDSDDEILMDLAATFQDAAWIGCGKQWSDPMPPEVVQARNKARLIPPGVKATALPPRNEPISSFLQRHLASATGSDTSTFCNEAPTVLLSSEETQIRAVVHHVWASVPSATYLRQAFDNAWLSGAKSLCLASDPKERYPLWVEHLLQDMAICSSQQSSWDVSAQWLSDRAPLSQASATLAVKCQDTWEVLPWTGPVPGFSPAIHLSMGDLSRFLSTKWLNDEMINAGLDYILRDLQKTARTILVNSLFVGSLRGMHKRNTYHSFPSNQLDAAVRNDEVDEIHIPTHVYNSHWTLLSIYLADRTYTYSDSLNTSASPPEETLLLLRWWLGELDPAFSGCNLTRVPAKYSFPQQADQYSCGVVVLSTLAHHLLDHEPWSRETEGVHRMLWFLRLSEGLQDNTEVWTYLCSSIETLILFSLVYF
jgi:hypothetical protein